MIHRNTEKKSTSIDDNVVGQKRHIERQNNCKNEVNYAGSHVEGEDRGSKVKRHMQENQFGNDENINNAVGEGGNFGEVFWRDNYYKLRDSRHEDVEDLESQVRMSKLKEGKLQSLMSLMEKGAGLVNYGEMLEAKDREIRNLTNKIKLYELLTCMSVKQESSGGFEDDINANRNFVCTLKNINKRSVVRFSIDHIKDSDQILFKPTANLKLFPDHLQSKIQCEDSMAPVLLADVIQNLYKDE